ncbi:MAG: hypothetical protein QUV05_17250 [Phycisphaerae bacterium]|nr:hypothetical protein [Phycisphaerae bacterium]
MFRSVEKPQIAVLGLSLELYQRAIPGYMERLQRQLHRYVEALRPLADVKSTSLCYQQSRVAQAITDAERADVDAVLLVPLSYTASGMSLAPLLASSRPIIVWNTQEAEHISDDYSFDTLLMNHVTQGTQDLTNALCRSGRAFGMESGHFKDQAALAKLEEWLRAARTARFARTIRVGILGHPFQDMGDFAIDDMMMTGRWGPVVIGLSVPELARLAGSSPADEVAAMAARDRSEFDVAVDLTESIHAHSAALEWGLRRLVADNRLDAMTFNFLDLIEDGRFETLPFLGVNKLIGEGLGYAGEGDVVTAAHMAQMRQLCGTANFTEMFTVDYAANRMLMMHMQECNPALARADRKIRLVRKEFWAPGIQPYVGMHFTLQPGPATLSCVTTVVGGGLGYLAYETRIADRPPLQNLDVPHWMVEFDEPVSDFLTRYSLAGGTHHLVAVPGHQARALSRLARLQGIGFQEL